MPDLIYTDDSWICSKCNKRYSAIAETVRIENLATYCPNCNVVMRRETYREALIHLTVAASELFADRQRLIRAVSEIITLFHKSTLEQRSSSRLYFEAWDIAHRTIEESNGEFSLPPREKLKSCVGCSHSSIHDSIGLTIECTHPRILEWHRSRHGKNYVPAASYEVNFGELCGKDRKLFDQKDT